MSYKSKLIEFRDDTRGTASIEFVLLFPVLMAIFFIGFESGIYMLRNAMLERAVDLSVREIRLNNGNIVNYDDLKQNICDETLVVPDCTNKLQVEVRPIAVQPGGVAALGTVPRCIDVDSTVSAVTQTNYDTASGNNLMYVRACLLSQPFFPSALLGTGMRVDQQGNYALVVASAFVNEPQNTASAAPVGNFLPPVAIPAPPTTVAPPPAGNPTAGNNGGGSTPSTPGNSGNNGNPGNNGKPVNNGNNGAGSGNNGNNGNNNGNNGNGNNGGNNGNSTPPVAPPPPINTFSPPGIAK